MPLKKDNARGRNGIRCALNAKCVINCWIRRTHRPMRIKSIANSVTGESSDRKGLDSGSVLDACRRTAELTLNKSLEENAQYNEFFGIF